MVLDDSRSLCVKQQKIIVSAENGREHRANNKEHQYVVRHFRLDGDLIKQVKCCDYLLLNDTKKDAFFIELKGACVDDAIPQLKAGVTLVRDEIPGYRILLRIVASNVRTHQLNSTAMRKLKKEYGGNVICKSGMMEEVL